MNNTAWVRFKRNRLALISFFILLILLLMTIIVPFFSRHNYYAIDLNLKNMPPSKQFWFGSDDLGRDLFVRTWYGARISLFVGITAALIDGLFGAFWGSLAAFAGGTTDKIMMSIADIIYSLPSLLIVIMLIVILGSGLLPILLAISIVGWITMARIVRAQVLQLKQQEYILAAKALGASSFHILGKHLLPNSIAPILVTITFTVPSAIFSEAFLSFLGLGIQAPLASWGTMAYEGLPALNYYPWRLFFPAFFISIAILAFNLVGDGLKDAFAETSGNYKYG